MPFWTYILHCRGGKFYTGHTDDLERRMSQHQSGLLAGFTLDHQPVELVWSQEFVTRYEAVTAERQIKGWSRAKKLALIRGDWERISALAKSKGGPSTGSGQTGLEVSAEILAFLREEAAHAHPNEACGLLLGTGTHITHAQPAKNVHPTPRTHFEIDPRALVDAHRAARGGEPEIVGYYHSHPTSAPEPSATDQAQAAGDGRVWAIVGADGEIRFWRDEHTGFTPLAYSADEA